MIHWFITALCTAMVHLISKRTGIPRILLYIFAGISLGSTGILSFRGEPLDLLVEVILLFVLFYGGLSVRDADKVRFISILAGFLMATVGVGLTAFALGLAANLLLPLNLIEAMTLGVILAPNDPVAVVSAVDEGGFSGEAEVIVKVESGFDDTLVVTATMLLIPSLLGKQIDPFGAAVDFLWLTTSAIFIGFAAGISADLFLEGLGSWLSLLISLFLASSFGSSPFVSSFVSGLTISRYFPDEYSRFQKIWDTCFYFAEATTFLMIGSLVNLEGMIRSMTPILLLTLVIILIRPLEVFLLTKGSGISMKEKILVIFTAMKGIDPVMLSLLVLLVAGIDFTEIVLGVVILLAVIQMTALTIACRLDTSKSISFIPLFKKLFKGNET